MKREPVKRPRPKQDLRSVTVRLSLGDLARLDRIATAELGIP